MAAFQAQTDWKTLKKRENKNYRFVSIRRIRDNSKKIAKKLKKLKKYHYGIISSQNRLEKAEKEKK